MSEIKSCIKHVDGYIRWSEGDECPICKLQARLIIANKQILDYEQTEAAVCPEDVGIERYVKSLQAQLATAKEENKRLKEPIKCASSFCDTLIHHQSYCPQCKKLWES